VETPTNDVWHHYAYCRDNLTIRSYRDGNLILSEEVSNDWVSTPYEHWGQLCGGVDTFTVSNFRVVSDTALYTGSTYTVPTADFV